MTLAQEYIETKAKFDELYSTIREQAGVKFGDLVLYNGKHYRAGSVSVSDKTGEAKIALKEIKNDRVGWSSMSSKINPTITPSEEFVVDSSWSFNHELMSEWIDQYNESDSLSLRESTRDDIEDLVMSCHHQWNKKIFDDEYVCACCGARVEDGDAGIDIDEYIENY